MNNLFFGNITVCIWRKSTRKHLHDLFFDRLWTAYNIYCCQLFCNKKKMHSKSRSRFCLIKMTLFKEHDCIYLHNRNRSSNSCNAVQQAYVNSRLAIYLRFVNEITELLGITAADCIMRGVRMCSCMGFLWVTTEHCSPCNLILSIASQTRDHDLCRINKFRLELVNSKF